MKNVFKKYGIVIENRIMVKGNVGKMAKADINIKFVKDCWEKRTGGKKVEFDRTYIDDTIKEIPTIIIQSNPKTIDRMDHLLSCDDLDLKEIQNVYKVIKGFPKLNVKEKDARHQVENLSMDIAQVASKRELKR